MITIVVGRGNAAETFFVEEPLLDHASPYFVKTLQSIKFKEGTSGRVVLDDKDREILALLNEFLHLGTIRQHGRTVSESSEANGVKLSSNQQQAM